MQESWIVQALQWWRVCLGARRGTRESPWHTSPPKCGFLWPSITMLAFGMDTESRFKLTQFLDSHQRKEEPCFSTLCSQCREKHVQTEQAFAWVLTRKWWGILETRAKRKDGSPDLWTINLKSVCSLQNEGEACLEKDSPAFSKAALTIACTILRLALGDDYCH